MKIAYLQKPPKDIYLAFSGGVDSAVLLHNLIRRKFNVMLLTVDHNTEFSDVEVAFSREMAETYSIPCNIFNIPNYDRSTSLEAFWSNHRNNIFQQMDKPVVTGHHLDDAVEWYLMSTFQGTPKLLNLRIKNVIRPLLGTSKEDIEEYARTFNLSFLTDPTNSDTKFNLRNKVRLDLIDNVRKHFPGISKTVKRLIIEKEKRNKDEEILRRLTIHEHHD